MDLTGKNLGKYELLERVGQGGMAYVYKAYQPTIDRLVAVKVLHSHLAEDAEFLERFKREAQGLGKLRHPHIVSVIDFDVADGWYYMVMDYIEGLTLRDYLDLQGVLPAAESLRIAAQLAGALDYAHRCGSIHRDIKPGNIMFADAAGHHAVITDFGIARLLNNATLTLSGTIAGTPAYMSPEAAQGKKVDARSDIYSLGVVLYEMVTGQRPYAGQTPLSVIMKLVLEPLPPALELNPDLPPAVDDLLQKAMAKLPEDRFQTAAEMAQAIAAAQQALGMEPTADGARPASLTAPAEPAPSPPEAAFQAETAVPSRKRSLPLILAGVALVVVLALGGFLAFTGGDDEAAAATPAVTTAPTTVVGGVDDAEETAVATVAPTLTPTATVTATAPAAPVAAGALRFNPPDENGLRPYTLTLENVPPPPGNGDYTLWLDINGREAPENIGELRVQNGRIDHQDALTADLAASVIGVRISVEPAFDDNPTISDDVPFTGVVDTAVGLDEIQLFAAGE